MSSAPFDPYEQWLGIAPHERPLDHYRLLGLTRFEADVAAIASAADRRMAVVRSAQTGRNAVQAQKVLNELATAKVCLLSAASKSAYDITLRLTASAPAPQPQQVHPGYLQPPAPQYRPAPAPAYYAPQPNWNAVPPPVPPPAMARPPAAARVAPPPAAAEPVAPPDELPPPNLWRRLMVPGMAIVLLAIAAATGWQIYRRLQTPPTVAGPPLESLPAEEPLPLELPAEAAILEQDSGGGVSFPIEDAALGDSVQLQGDLLANWNSPAAAAQWQFHVAQPGFFRLELVYATGPQATTGGAMEATIGKQRKRCELRPSGGLDKLLTDTYPLAVPTSGRHTLILHPTRPASGDWLVIRSVRLIPVGGATSKP